MSLHCDAHLIDKIGRPKLCAYFDCSDASVRRWRRKGIPRNLHKALIIYCALNDVTREMI